jgi:hypothetical protein
MEQEIFMPFHWKTFRFIRLNIDVGSTDLVFDGVEIETVNYPLEAEAQIIVSGDDAFVENFWTAGIRTFENCMHDCYEDCPFYERMQYAMGTRSMSLFTYLLSGDDQLARQAIVRTSYQAEHGLTQCRSPSHQVLFILLFALYGICMLGDHLTCFNNPKFLSRFLPVVDSNLLYFHSRIGELGLTVCEKKRGSGALLIGLQNGTDMGLFPPRLSELVSQHVVTRCMLTPSARQCR